ncbi:MAG TPA: hypothetical protein PLH56_03845 [Candidatus Omnitrophota bacterium]|nr:hypothetical protein [Candidatus Omnitrophota bacterium]
MGEINPHQNFKNNFNQDEHLFIESVTPEEELSLQAVLLAEVVKRLLETKANLKLSEKPNIQKQPIVEFRKRMRVVSLDKFPIGSYISVVNFYLNEKEMKVHKAIGAIVVSVAEDYISFLFKKMEYPLIDDDDPAVLEDAVGTLANLIAGNFKAGITQWGYQDLAMSSFRSYKNDVIDGVEFDATQKEKYVISFIIRGTKMIDIELTLGKVPRNQAVAYKRIIKKGDI